MQSPVHDAETPPAPPPEPPEPHRYCRDLDHRIVGGVAAGLAGATGIHVAAIRIAFVVAALLHGAGVVAYAAAWIALPTLSDALAGRSLRRAPERMAAGAVLAFVALLILLIPFGDWLGNGPLALPVALVGVAVALWQPTPRVRFPGRSRSATDALPALATPGPVGRPAPIGTAPRPGQPRSALARLTLAAALLAVGGALVLDRTGTIALTASRAVSLVLLVLGGGLLAAAFIGRGRWLVIPVIPLLPVALGIATVDRMGLDPFAASGQSFAPATAAEVQPLYRNGTGEIMLDLSQVKLGGETRTVTVQNALGDVLVLVPDDVAVAADGQTALGSVVLLGRGGPTGTDRREAVFVAPTSPRGRLELHLRTGFGSITVAHGSSNVASPASVLPTGGRP